MPTRIARFLQIWMGLLVASVAKVFRLCRCLYSSLFLACAQDPSERRAWKGEKQEFKPGELTAWNMCMCFSNLHAQASFYPSQDTREIVMWAEGLELGAATKERLVTGKVSEPEDLVALLQLENGAWNLTPPFSKASSPAVWTHWERFFQSVSLELFLRLGGSGKGPGSQPSHLQHCNGATSSISACLQRPTSWECWTWNLSLGAQSERRGRAWESALPPSLATECHARARRWVSQNCFVLDVVKFKNSGSLAELFRF